tara:strand:+ start:1431 stop:2858 length:1428 start_codon:yes stop_codon:yes gene_type:complete
MAYTINKTDGTNVLGGTKTLADGTSDNSTSLTLFGKSFSNFGEFLNENQIKLLENSASTTAPAAPLRGELWFDTTVNILKVYDGTSFKPAGGSKSSATAPTNPGAGDLWTDSDDDQLYVYTGSAWQLVGPVYTKGQTLSGWKIETLGSSGGNKVVSSMYAGNTRVAIVSKETFTPSVTQTGFAEIKAGLTLNSTLGAVFDGTNTQAAQIDVTSTTNTSGTIIAGGNFVRADAADSMTGALTVDADGGIVIGDAQELSITVTSNNVTVAQTSQDKDLSFTINDGGVTKTPLTFEGDSGNITLTGTTTITGNTTVTGNLTITGEFENSSSEINIVNDAFLKLNTGNLEADAGIIVETTDTDDARLFYDVSENRWSAGENQSYSLLMRESDATADGNANKNTKFLRTTAAGLLTVTNVSLAAVGSAIATTDTSSVSVPTIGQVATFGNLWGGSAKTVSTSEPTGGDGDDGDFWFVREA